MTDLIHLAQGFTKTACGIDFSNKVPCQMTNVKTNVTCPDCITIMAIWDKNRV